MGSIVSQRLERVMAYMQTNQQLVTLITLKFICTWLFFYFIFIQTIFI